MIHLLIDNEGRKKEYTEDQAKYLAGRCAINVCNATHVMDLPSVPAGKSTYYDKSEYTIYHPGTRSGRMLSLMDVDERLRELLCSRCNEPLTICKCEPRGM